MSGWDIMKKKLKIVANIVFALLIAAMAVLAFFSVSSKISSDGVSKIANYRFMTVLSGSMHPAFEAGDVIVVDGERDQFRKDDIITFKDPLDSKRIITHRVAEVLQNVKGISYRTKGDANNATDLNLVPQANVIGIYKIHVPKIGYAINFAKTTKGLIWLIIVPGILIIINELRAIAKAISEEKEVRKPKLEATAWKKEEHT